MRAKSEALSSTALSSTLGGQASCRSANTDGQKPRRLRSVPPPPAFDPATLGDNILLTSKELAGRPGFPRRRWCVGGATIQSGPPFQVAGKPRYRVGDVRQWLLADPPAERRALASLSEGQISK